MAWFNTDWNIANMFNLPTVGGSTNNPYGFTGGQAGGNMIVPWTNTVTGQTWDAPNTGYQPPNSNWQMTGGNKTDNLNSVWGAPAYYQAPTTSMFGNNPYQAQDGGFYNPNIFGQMSYPSQYNTNQQPWWMNYNTNNSIVNNSLTSNMPTSTQADPSIVPRPGGTGPGGKDLTHAETIKYFGLYDDAETAFAAGDKQSAYRKDHMHWRAGTGAWEGKGKKPGQSDLDYPGRTTADGNVILGDRQKLGAWSGIGNDIQDYFKARQMFNITANDQGGNDYTVKDDGILTTNNGTIIETGMLTAEEKAAQDLMLEQQDLDLQNRRNIFFGDYFSGRGPHYMGEVNPVTSSVIQPTPESNIDKNIFTPKNLDVPFISDYSADSRFIPAGAVDASSVNADQLTILGPFSAEEQLKRDEAEQRRYALTDGKINARWESEQISNNLRQQTIDNNPFIAEFVDQGLLSMDEVPLHQPTLFAISSDGMTKPMPDELINIFSGGDSDAYLNSQREMLAAAAKSKADAEAYEAEQKRIADAKAAEAAAKAAAEAAEKAKQAKAQSYDTGYVRPNKYVQQYEQLKKAGAPVRRSGNRYGFGL